VSRQRAVVTGGAGFLGSHLVERLTADGVDVLVIDDLSTGLEADLVPEARFERRDIADGDLDGPIVAFAPEVVYHLAAQASVPLSQREPLRDLAVNVIGTNRVASAARDGGARRIVFVSSGGAVYGESDRPATEATRPAPSSYYGVHKLAAEGHIALAGISSAIARPSNIYGPRQRGGTDGAVVAAFLQQAREHGRLEIHGDGRQTRDFIHVRDTVEALCRLGRPATGGGVWNVAAGRPVSILELADRLEAALGIAFERRHGPARDGDVRHSSISAARLRGIGWKPALTLSAGLRDLIGPVSPGSSPRT
jgi:UDP-glucose 4-epimerase